MALPKLVIVKESNSELNKLLKTSSSMIIPRLRMLKEIKRCGIEGISKRDLADAIGVNHNSIQTWRSAYLKGGLELLMSSKSKDGRPSILTSDEHKAIEAKLKDANNGLRGYIELWTWAESEFKKNIKYNTLLKYAIREFGSSIKVARKSHVKKDEIAVQTFKKTLVKSAKKPSIKEKNTKL